MRALWLVLLLSSASARADDGMRCGQWLVSVGARQPEVSSKCGAPTSAATHQECGWHVCTTCDVWTYDRGPSEFVRTLIFARGVLRAIEVGGYGN